MNICDRCYNAGEYQPGTKNIGTSTHETFSLCDGCYAEFMEFMTSKTKKEKKNAPGRPRKAAGKAEKKGA